MTDNTEFDQMLKRIQSNTQKKNKNTNALAAIDPVHDAGKNSVTKSNALARAYYRYSLVEKRVMEILVSQLHPLRTDNKFQGIELTALAYAQAFNVDTKHAYEHLAKAVHGLTRQVISVPGDGMDDRIEWPLMAEARYRKQQGKIICTFNPLVVPHLVGLTKHFTKYPLSMAVDFNSSYTWRFFELLMSWSSGTNKLIKGELRITVDELRSMLGVPKSYRWDNFQKQVLDLVQPELEDKANIRMRVARKKTGRKITHLHIVFMEGEQQQLPL